MAGSNDSKNLPWWVFLIFTFGGLLAFQRGGNSPAEKSADSQTDDKAAAVADQDTDEGAWLQPLETFVGHPTPPKPSAPPSATTKRLDIHIPLLEELTRDAFPAKAPQTPTPSPKNEGFGEHFIESLQTHVGKLDFLIATVADPKETQSNYRFDLHLDALHKAAAAEGMVLDGYYLPWEDKQDPTKARQEPGVLLYRSTPSNSREEAKRDLLLVFLVGELPTTGIHKTVFHESVNRILRLRDALPANTKHQRVISVVGPIFSGSSDSLAIAMVHAAENRDRKQRPKFRVISGSANVVDKQRFEELAGNRATYHSTLVHSNYMQTALINYAAHNNLGRTSVAWLAESSSGTGAESLQRSDDDAALALSKNVDMYEFLFPMNIAKVRAVYTEQERRDASSQSPLGPGRYRLAIPFGETSTARDIPTMQTPQLTAPATEILISQMIDTIRRRRIKHVVISSIDSRDPMFLAEMVRRHCPDAQLMLLNPEVIQLHSEFRSVLHGALVASTYSLNPEEQSWCFPYGRGDTNKERHRYLVMGDQSYYGIYNAVIFLRSLENQTLELSTSNKIATGKNWKPADKDDHHTRNTHLIAYGPPLQRERAGDHAPPVWISRLGPTGFHPVKTVTLPPDEYWERYPELIRVTGIPTRAEPEFNGRITVETKMCSLGWLAAVIVYAVWRRKKIKQWNEPPNAWTRNYIVLPHLFCTTITATLICMLFLWGLLLLPSLLPQSNIGLMGWAFNLVQLLVSAVFVFWLIWILVSDLRDGNRKVTDLNAGELRGQQGVLELLHHLRWLFSVLICVIVLGLGIAVVVQICDFIVHPNRMLFWFASWTDIWNGISFLPALQFLAATLILLAYGMLRQVELLQDKRSQAPPTATDAAGRGSGDMWAQILFPLLKRYEQWGEALNYRRVHGCWQSHSGPVTAASATDAVTSSPAATGAAAPATAAAVAPATQPVETSPAETEDEKKKPKNREVVTVSLIGGLAWLTYVISQLPNTDFLSAKILWIGPPFNAMHAVFVLICAYWFLRYMKLLELMQSLLRTVENRYLKLQWSEVFKEHKLTVPSLADLLIWPRWPDDEDIEHVDKTQKRLGEIEEFPDHPVRNMQIDAIRDELIVAQMQLYVRQLCFHCSRLLLGVIGGALLIFLAANSYPYNMQPLLRLTSSLILAAVAIAMTWFYIKLDRNPVISGIVGSTPHELQFNWSMIQTLGPALGLTVLAFISQVFPEAWHWLRETIDPGR